MNDGLHADVQGQAQGRVVGDQALIEALFDAGKALIVDIGHTDHMGPQIAMGVNASFTFFEI